MAPPRFAPPPTRYGPTVDVQAKPGPPPAGRGAVVPSPPTKFGAAGLQTNMKFGAAGLQAKRPNPPARAAVPPPPTKFLATVQAKPVTAPSRPAVPPPPRPASAVQAPPLPAVPGRRPALSGSPVAAGFRTQVVQRMEAPDELTDDEEEIDLVSWVHFPERPKMPTLYSYSLAQGGNPKVDEGPHTVANVVYRRIFEQITATDAWDELRGIFGEQPTPEQLEAILAEEGVDEEGKGKLKKYLSEYRKLHTALATDDRTVAIKPVVEQVWRLANLHPLASYGWKTALRSGRKVSSRSSKTKGERLRLRKVKRLVSVTNSAALVDTGGRFASSGYRKFIEKKLTRLFGSKAKAKRYLARNGAK